MDASDEPVCPILGMLEAARDYRPAYAYDSAIASKHGRVVVKENGDCSSAAPNSSGWFDFTIPCKAHDFCFDLIRSGFRGTVNRNECDTAFLELMLSSCSKKTAVLVRPACEYTAHTYSTFESGATTPANTPGQLLIRSQNSAKCLNLHGGWTDGPVVQYPCISGAANGEWQIVEAMGFAGYFLVKNYLTDECLSEYYTANFNSGQLQYVYLTNTCLGTGGAANQRFHIQSVSSQDVYTLRVAVWSSLDRCVNVPGAYLDDDLQVITWPCAEAPNDSWTIEALS